MYTFINYKIIRETEKSWRVRINDKVELWVPKSKCSITPRGVKIPTWIVEDNLELMETINANH